MSELVFANARLVLRHSVVHGALRVVDDMIAEWSDGESVPPGAVDLEGDYLLPGLVELHTDVLEHHAFPRPGVTWPLVPAALAYDADVSSAGITTVLDSLAVGYAIDAGQRPRDPRALVEALRAARDAALLRSEHFLHLRCEISTEHVLGDFAPFADDPLVRLVSLMDHTPGQRQYADVAKYRLYYQGKYGMSDDGIDRLIAQRLADRDRFGEKHRAAVIALCHKYGLPMASHDDATRAQVEEAAEAGTVIAEFPTTLDAAFAARAFQMAVLAGAPNLVCGRSHSGNVSAGTLAATGLIDILSSDYVPASLLHGAFVLHGTGVPLPDAVATVTWTPASRVGLSDRGAIAPGLRADLVRVHANPAGVVVRGVWCAAQRVA